MVSPNFFILGAPKCGTTSLASWLSDHPHIFIPPIKEPHYFNTDDQHRNIRRRLDYEKLFRGVTEKHIGVGEASVWYLSSEVAVRNILDACAKSQDLSLCCEIRWKWRPHFTSRTFMVCTKTSPNLAEPGCYRPIGAMGFRYQRHARTLDICSTVMLVNLGNRWKPYSRKLNQKVVLYLFGRSQGKSSQSIS